MTKLRITDEGRARVATLEFARLLQKEWAEDLKVLPEEIAEDLAAVTVSMALVGRDLENGVIDPELLDFGEEHWDEIKGIINRCRQLLLSEERETRLVQ